MIAVIATFTVAEGQTEAFEAAAGTLVAAVRAKEPGVSLYTLVRSKKEPNIYKMMELYDNKDVFRAHGSTEWFLAGIAEIKPLLAAELVVEILDPVA